MLFKNQDLVPVSDVRFIFDMIKLTFYVLNGTKKWYNSLFMYNKNKLYKDVLH